MLAESALADFQDHIARALFDPDDALTDAPDVAALARQPGFAVYRNTVMKACIDALQANYPCVARLVGDEWFRSVAALYTRAHPPSNPTLVDYGRDFPGYLSAFEPARELPYLPGVAQLDRYWTEAHAAGDDPPLDPYALAAMPPERLLRTTLRPVSAARWSWFDELPIFTIWRRNRTIGPIDASEFDWHGEGALLVRTGGEVRWMELDAPTHAFLAACAEGRTLGDAASATLAADPRADPCRVVEPLLDLGVFAAPAGPTLRLQEPQT